MTVKVSSIFTKPSTLVPTYSNKEMELLVAKYFSSDKIIEKGRDISEDGLVETRTLVFADEESYDEFKAEDVRINNQLARQIWCKENNVSVKSVIVE